MREKEAKTLAKDFQDKLRLGEACAVSEAGPIDEMFELGRDTVTHLNFSLI